MPSINETGEEWVLKLVDRSDRGKLGLLDAVGMSLGGMIGGGIFAVLGVAATQVGKAAFVSFGLAGLLALVTGLSYCKLTLKYDEYGGSFTFIEELAGPWAAGTVSWFLILGYILTISLYAHTFAAYAAKLIGAESSLAVGTVGAAIIVFFAALNLAGVRESAVTEDVLVYSKIILLVALVVVGFFTLKGKDLTLDWGAGVVGITQGAALIFVAYEGFQLLTYDYDDIADHHVNLPRAMGISIPTAMLLYVAVAFVTTASVSAQRIAENEETVLAMVVEPVFGHIGFVAVVVAAVFSTASAINATMFATNRLAHRVGDDGELPAFLVAAKRAGVPVVFLVTMGVLAILLQLFGNLEQIATFSSLTFLIVFATVNGAGLLTGLYRGLARAIPALGMLGCVYAAVVLTINLFVSDRVFFWVVVAVCVFLLGLRVAYYALVEDAGVTRR